MCIFKQLYFFYKECNFYYVFFFIYKIYSIYLLLNRGIKNDYFYSLNSFCIYINIFFCIIYFLLYNIFFVFTINKNAIVMYFLCEVLTSITYVDRKICCIVEMNIVLRMINGEKLL